MSTKVILESGAIVPEALVKTTWKKLQDLNNHDRGSLLQLALKCANPYHEILAEEEGRFYILILQQYRLIDLDGNIPISVSNIVLNAHVDICGLGSKTENTNKLFITNPMVGAKRLNSWRWCSIL